MKYSIAIASCLASMATAKAVRNSYPVKREPQDFGVTFQRNGMAGFGITETSRTEVIIIWANPGGGAATTTLNQQVTVTQTVTVAGGGAAANTLAPIAAAPPVAGTPVNPQGASPVVAGVGATHSVTVGGPAGLVFVPDQLQANVGDMVIFTFLGNNHTATQSAFASPCDVLAGGMDSGFMSNPNSTVTPAPQVAMQVMVADPLWFFCAQNAHCGKGMTFSINPNQEKTHAMFQQMAIAQRGTGGQSAITGGAPAAAAPAAPAAAPPAAGAAAPPPDAALAPLPGAAGVDPNAALAPLPGAAGAPAVSVSAGTGVVTGTGTLNADGSCSCSVSCGAGAFPNIAEQGVNAFGGMSGSLPVSAVGAV